MDSRGVCYFSVGTKHLLRLCVSLNSLRKHYDGNVAILNGGGDNGVCDRIGRALGADVLSIPIVQRRRNTAYCTKPTLWRYSPFETTLLIDADTTIAGDITPLLDFAETGLVVTRFSTWLTQGRMLTGRISKWRGVKCDGIDVEKLIDDSLDAPHLAINTGLVGFDKTYGRDFLRDWESLTSAGWRCPLTDEISAQLLLRKHKHTIVDDRYNCSPLHGRNKDRAVVWHFHGNKELRAEAIPYYESHFRCIWDEDAAGVRSWMPRSDIENHRNCGLILD